MNNLMAHVAFSILGVGLLLLGPASAKAGDVVYVDADVLRIEGEITIRTAIEFDRALSDIKDPVWVQLNSSGGSVYSALLIARRIHSARLYTRILSGDLCSSACALIFAAGKERVATGQLGVHQMSMDRDSNEAIQFAMGDVIEELYAFDIPSSFVTSMLRTPKESMYWFNDIEISDMGFYFSANRQEPPAPDTLFNDPDLPSGLGYLDKGILLIQAYFDQVPERELFRSQATLTSWSEMFAVALDGQWGPQTEGVFREIFETYTAIGGSDMDWGVNSVADVTRFLSWIDDAAYANNNPDRVEFPD